MHDGGTYLCMEGPQFSTLAESRLYRALGLRRDRHDQHARGQTRPRGRALLCLGRHGHRLRLLARGPWRGGRGHGDRRADRQRRARPAAWSPGCPRCWAPDRAPCPHGCDRALDLRHHDRPREARPGRCWRSSTPSPGACSDRRTSEPDDPAEDRQGLHPHHRRFPARRHPVPRRDHALCRSARLPHGDRPVADPLCRPADRQGRGAGGARLHPGRRRGAPAVHRLRADPQEGQAAGPDHQPGLHAGIRRGGGRGARRRHAARATRCCWSTTCWPPAAPPRPASS